MNAVIFYKMRHGFVIGDIVYRNHFNRRMIEQQSEQIPSDSSKSVNGNSRFQILMDVFFSMIGRTHQGTAFYMAESHFLAQFFVFFELFGRDEFFNW